MPLPRPEPGLVLSYAYLWRHEHNRGLEEGVKARPCAVVLAAQTQDGKVIMTVAPITHRTPPDLARDPAAGGCQTPSRVGRGSILDHRRRGEPFRVAWA